jgi:hypothetical protein
LGRFFAVQTFDFFQKQGNSLAISTSRASLLRTFASW